MEITKQIKIKAMAAYLWHQTTNEDYPILTPIELSVMYEKGIDRKLILKPLDKITHEDAKVCAQIILGNKDVDDNMVIKVRHRLRDETFTRSVYGMNYAIRAFQYLQNQGYDLPHYLLGNKTLKESGLAVYI